jgi:magnesium transporter
MATHTQQTNGLMHGVHDLIWEDGHVRVDAGIPALLEAKHSEASLVWLDLDGEPHQFRQMLRGTFGLSEIVLDIVEEERERSKLTERHGYFHLVVHGLSFDTATEEAETPKIDIIFGANWLITIHRSELPWLETLRDSARKDAAGDEHIMARGMAVLLHAVLDTLTDSYFPILDDIDDIVDDLENVAIVDTSNSVQGRIFRLKRTLAQMRRVISPQVEVMNSLVNLTGPLIPRESEIYFADVHDHLVRAFEVIDSYRDLMSGLLDVHLSTVSNRLNQVMKQLTIIATVFLPITFITGVFGMNFGHSPQVDHDNGWNFWIVLLVMALVTAGQFWYFRRKGWVG